METKDTLSSCSDSKEQEIQQLQKHAKILKEKSLNKLNALQTTIQHLSSSNYLMYFRFRDAFHRHFKADERTFKSELSRNMQNLESQFNKETLHEKDSSSDLLVIKNGLKRLNERKLQIQKYKVQEIKASDVSLGDKDCSRIVSENQINTSGDESSMSRNEFNDKNTFRDDTDIKPSYDTKLMVEVDSNVIPDSPDMFDNDIQTDQNAEDERAALFNLIANLKLDIYENKTIQKQLKKANALLTQELQECESTLAETSRILGESNSIRDSCLIALQNKKLSSRGQKEIDIKEGLKLKAYEILVVKEKHDELVKQSLLTKSHYEGLVKEKTNVIRDLKLKEEKDIDKMISMEKKLKFLNEIVYKRSQPIQTIHMLAPKGPTFNGELKKLIEKMKCKSVDTNFKKTINLEETTFATNHKSTSVTPHFWPQVRKSSFAKPYDVNAPGPFRNSPKHVSFQSARESIGSNDMVHNYYLAEAKKKAQLQKEKALNTEPSVQQSARLPNTANGNKPKPRNFNQQARNWPPSMSSRKKAIHLILTGIRDEIYSTVDACQKLKKCGKLSKGYNKYFKKIYKPTNNNLRTSSDSRNKNVDTTPHYKNGNQSRQFGNQRTVNVAGARENVGSSVVQQSRIQCFNCKEFGHFAKECKKPKRVKDFAYHKEKMLLCKQAEQSVPLQAEQYDWLADTDKEVDEQELEAHYSYMAKIQEVPTADTCIDSEPVEQVQNDAGYNVFANDLQHYEQSESVSNTCLVETDDSNVIPDSPDICNDDIQNDQNDVESDDERIALANLIANLKLDTEFEKYKAFNDCTVDYDKLKQELNETLSSKRH
nr:hypothetical protein [Tanacetum cinerariifolium]